MIGQFFNTILIQPLVNALFLIYGIIPGHDFGVAIILLTILIRLILWPRASKQLHSQKKMQSLQGDISKVKIKAGGDKQKEQAMLMELYKEKEVNPFSACLPAILQFPILIAMFVVFKKATGSIDGIENLLYEPVKNLSYISSVLSGQTAFNTTLFGLIDMAKPSYLLAIVAGLTQFVQVKMITPRKQKTDAADPQAKMTSFMNYTFPALTVFIAWGLPAALPTYWITTNFIAIFQQWLIMRGEVDEMEKMDVVKVIRKGDTSKATKKLPKPKVKTKPKKGKK
ncbi:MAG: YidC/Oxa1 family membrane protein insertase [Patescibacteria group bacterium]|nr:YidC/Oxa1 family membrane protein insertase [Patescibacteria group bacterium]